MLPKKSDANEKPPITWKVKAGMPTLLSLINYISLTGRMRQFNLKSIIDICKGRRDIK